MSERDEDRKSAASDPNKAQQQLFQAIRNWATDANRMPVAHLATAALLELEDPVLAADAGPLYAVDRILSALSPLSGDRPDGARPRSSQAPQ
jgi:hypothetical protein